MNKVITINLTGNAYQIEEGGYEALRAYLDRAARQLLGNPDRDEIIADIEQAIADKCRSVLGANKTVVTDQEAKQIIEEMGPVEDAPPETAENAATAAGPAASAAGPRPGAGETEAKAAGPARRLYRLPDGAMIGGVCNGLAARFNIDVTLVRIAFVVLTWFWCAGVLVYLLLMLLLPTAGTSTEKAAAYGLPATAQEFIRRAKEGYYEGFRTFGDKRAHREWRRRFRHEMRGWSRALKNDLLWHAHHWRPPGGAPWAPVAPPATGAPPPVGAWVALPFASVLRAGLALLGIFALVSLLATGAVLGVPLPAGLPVWAGVLGLFLFYLVLAWPLKAMRRAYYWNARAGPFGLPPVVYAFEACVGIGFVVVLGWWTIHHLPLLHDAAQNIPLVFHQGVDAVRDWWSER